MTRKRPGSAARRFRERLPGPCGRRKRKRERVAKILSEFKGLGHIADARNNGARNKLGSVMDCRRASRT